MISVLKVYLTNCLFEDLNLDAADCFAALHFECEQVQ
jgi:hypothetical protein